MLPIWFKRGSVVLGAAGLLALAGLAKADTNDFNWTSPGTNVATNDAAGKINSIQSQYDSTTQSLSWSVNFTGAPGTGALPDGFHLVLDGGPNPKGYAGQLAYLFLDASKGSPILTAYGYNGQNDATSPLDGSPAAGTQTPDRIQSSLLDSSWIHSLTSTTNADGSRTLGFDIDVTGINSFVSPYTPAGTTWEGAQYGNDIGIWFHPYDNVSSTYKNGYLNSLSVGTQGWLDTQNLPTTPHAVTPETNSFVLLCVGLAGAAPAVLLRRRKKG